jgi:hypothetical protein
MPADATFDPAGVVAAGLAVVAELAGDPSLATGGAGLYGTLKEALAPEIRPGDRATIALPCVRMADRLPALLVVLQDRAILAWKSGTYRKTLHAEAVPLSASWGATIAPGTGARQPVKVLTVQWAEHPPWVLAVPSDASTTRFLRTCFIAAPGSG